jgi:hypothetical protein
MVMGLGVSWAPQGHGLFRENLCFLAPQVAEQEVSQ